MMCSTMNANFFAMPTVDKWTNICRLCSEERNEMLPIFGDEGLQRRVVQKLQACLPVLVYKTDPLPKQICQFCAARLDDVYEFREYYVNVFKSMYAMLSKYQQLESVQVFLHAMKTSQDPCQAQLCKDKSRAPPPLVPLSVNLSLDDSITTINQDSQDQNACMETLSELPCEVEIKEMGTDPILSIETAVCESLNSERKPLEMFNSNAQIKINTIFISDKEKERTEYQIMREEKRTSILEQVLTGNLTMTSRQKIQPKAKLTSEWWCKPCNHYYKTKDSLVKHIQRHCPRLFTCKKCSLSFKSVKLLAKHEANSHLKVILDFMGTWKDCHRCDREFVSWDMLRQHRLHDHLAELTEIGTNTWCSLCNRFFPTLETYQDHVQLHQTNCNSSIAEKLNSTGESMFSILKIMERSKEGKKGEQFHENAKSLTCSTCGKVCTQQSALSNHMRTHEPKRHKCEICGRSFGLFIRLATHRMSEHNKQPTMSPVFSAVEQEEALNSEREAREARETRIRGAKMIEKDNHLTDEESLAKRNFGELRNVARCGICLQWFSDHTTMLTHLQTHSDSYLCKNFTCHVCKKSFKEQWQLSRHEACHKRLTFDNASLYTCAVCNKSFWNKLTYKAHQKAHTVNKTYHCAKCNKIFFKEVSLLTHQCTGETLFGKKAAPAPSPQRTLPYGNKRYKCSKCDAFFSSLQSRNAHMKTHTESAYSNAARSPREIKIEADDEPMPKLRRETSLECVSLIEPKVEINEQSAPVPLKRTLIKTAGGYRCGVCQSPFVLRDLAVAHLRSAHPIMPYQCPYCKKRFTTQYMFTHHIKAEHPDEPEK